jgi:hypothetical protein
VDSFKNRSIDWSAKLALPSRKASLALQIFIVGGVLHKKSY